MAKDYKVVNGIRFAKDVNTSKVDWDGPTDPELLEELKKPGKMRITTMIDEDVYDALKKAAIAKGDGRYQTYLNQLLRNVLMNPTGIEAEGRSALAEMIKELEEQMKEQMKKQTDAMQRRIDSTSAKMMDEIKKMKKRA